MTSCEHYHQLLSKWPAVVAETKQDPNFLTERHLQAMWLEQRYFGELKTQTGQPIEIISPGIWNVEAGPDFCKAHLRIGGQDLKGDIEIHLADSNWNHHRHDDDERYDNVVLHVSLWVPTRDADLYKRNGEKMIRTYLEPALTIPLKRIVQLIDLDLYPYKKFVGSGKCAQALFHALSEEKVEGILASAGYYRLGRKRIFLEHRVPRLALRLAAGFAMALGYKANTDTFLDLFLWLQPFSSLPLDDLLALAMGVCGFFEEPYLSRWQPSGAYRSLATRWTRVRPADEKKFKIVVGQSRPLNHPIRRLVTLCCLLQDSQMHHLLEDIFVLWALRWPHCRVGRDFTELKNCLMALLPTYESDYWNHHFLFEEAATADYLPLVGEDLRQQVLVNTVLPLLYGQVDKSGKAEELIAFDSLYRSFRAVASGKRDYLVHRFFGETQKGQLLKRSFYEQGALQIHRDFCLHYEASCEGCPFVERIRQHLDSL